MQRDVRRAAGSAAAGVPRRQQRAPRGRVAAWRFIAGIDAVEQRLLGRFSAFRQSSIILTHAPDAARHRRTPRRVASGAPSQTPEATSLFGKPLVSAPPVGEQKTRLEADLAKAQADYDRDPSNADAAICSDAGSRISAAFVTRLTSIHAASLGTRTRHGSTATAGTATSRRENSTRRLPICGGPRNPSPENPTRSSRTAHRTRPAFPAARCSRTSGNLGLAQYLRGDFRRRWPATATPWVSRVNDDMLVATSDWLYMTLRRLKRDDEARQVLEPIKEQMDILENGAYHARLLMYKGLRTPESVLNPNTADDIQIATQGYGVGTGTSSTATGEGEGDLRPRRRREGVDRVWVHRGRGRLETRSLTAEVAENAEKTTLCALSVLRLSHLMNSISR